MAPCAASLTIRHVLGAFTMTRPTASCFRLRKRSVPSRLPLLPEPAATVPAFMDTARWARASVTARGTAHSATRRFPRVQTTARTMACAKTGSASAYPDGAVKGALSAWQTYRVTRCASVRGGAPRRAAVGRLWRRSTRSTSVSCRHTNQLNALMAAVAMGPAGFPPLIAAASQDGMGPTAHLERAGHGAALVAVGGTANA